jgi:hypothetical protein
MDKWKANGATQGRAGRNKIKLTPRFQKKGETKNSGRGILSADDPVKMGNGVSSSDLLCDPEVGLLVLHRLRDLGPLGADGDHQQRAGLAQQPAAQTSPQTLQ